MQEVLECIWDQTQQEDLNLTADTPLPWEKLDGKTVLVTGATGLIGSLLIKTLLAANRIHNMQIRILAFARSREKAENVLGELLLRPELNLQVGDVTSPFEAEGPVNFIIHAASQTASKEFVTHPVETLATSFDGTRNILELARRKQCQSVVYISSMEAYGNPYQQEHRTSEKELGYIDHLNVRSSYSEGKRVCECLCSCYHSEYGIPTKIVRLAQTFGAGVSLSENRVFAQFAKAVMHGEDIVLHTKGESYGNYCYSADAVAGILTVLLLGENGEAYNVVCEAATMKIFEMAQLVAARIADGRIKVAFDIPESSLTYGYAPDVVLRLDGQKLRNLGWKPWIGPDLETMYRRMISSFKAQDNSE